MSDLSLKELKQLLDDNEIDLSARQLKTVPMELCQIPRATRLDLTNNRITMIPADWCLRMTHLTRLELGNNSLPFLPDTFGALKNLQHLDLYKNEIEELPLSFTNLRSLVWLDLKKNPLEQELAKAVGNCGTEKECREAAKNVLGFMNARQSALDNQIAKQDALVKKARVVEQKKQDNEKKKAKKQSAARDQEMANKTKKQQQQQGAHGHNNHHEGNEKKVEKKKQQEPPKKKGRGVICSLIRWAFFISLIAVGAATVTVLINCSNGGKQVANSQALCKDFTKLSQFEKPGPKFVENLKTVYTTVFKGYQAKIQRTYADFAKSEIGQKVDVYLHKVHAVVVEYSLLAYRYILQAYDAFLAWYARDGEKMFGVVVENVKVGAKIVWEMVKDVTHMCIEAGKLFIHRVDHFIADVSQHGFSKAFEKAIQH